MKPFEERLIVYIKDILEHKRIISIEEQLFLLYDIWKNDEDGLTFKMFMGSQDRQLRSYLLRDRSMGGLKRGKYYNLIFRYIYGDTLPIEAACSDSKDAKAKEQGQYPYIPLYAPNFSLMIDYIANTYGHRKSFIDVGCGIGDKVLFAFLSRLFDECYGIEYDSISYRIAKYKTERLMACYTNSDKEHSFYESGESIIQGDAFDHNYSKYDTAYLYCPMSNGKMMRELIEHIHTTQKKGSIICLFLDNFGVARWGELKGIKVEYEKTSGAWIIHK